MRRPLAAAVVCTFVLGLAVLVRTSTGGSAHGSAPSTVPAIPWDRDEYLAPRLAAASRTRATATTVMAATVTTAVKRRAAVVPPRTVAPEPTSGGASPTSSPEASRRPPKAPEVPAAPPVLSGPHDRCGGWRDEVAALWPLGEVDRACRILLCESGGDPRARNRSGATGLMQVMGGSLDPDANLTLAHAMWLERGWRPWVCR